MLYGDWDVFEGQYFPEFSRDIHVVEPFVIPKEWNRYLSIDYGLDMLACIWFAIDKDNNAYAYKELHESGLIISEAAKKILEVNGDDDVIKRYAPPDLWNKRQETGQSAYDVFKENGVKLHKSKNDRVLGWYSVKEYLKVTEVKDEQTGDLKKSAKLKIFTNCRNLINYIPQIQYDKRDPNDTATEPHIITHILDALRGFCIERTYPTKSYDEEEDRLERLKLFKRRKEVGTISYEAADNEYIYYGG